MDKNDPSMSEVKEQNKERKEQEEEEQDVLLVTEKDLKQRNIDIDAEESPWTCLLKVCEIGYEKYMQQKREMQEKKNAILEDGKLYKLLREKALKKPADYLESKKQGKIVGEKLLGSASKNYEIRYGVESNFKSHEIDVRLNQNCKVSDSVHDIFTTRKTTFATVEGFSCSMESYRRNGFRPGIMTEVNDEELNQDLYLRKDSILERFYAQGKSKGSKSSKRSKEEMPNLDFGSLAELPQEVKERIASMKGKNVELVIEKQLYPTDMNDGNSRLSIPLKQVIAKNFLAEEEKSALRDANCLAVKILEPSLEMVSDMNLRQWNMSKENGNVSSSYVFITHWNTLRKRNLLNLLDTIQVWSFRVENKLYFAIVKVK